MLLKMGIPYFKYFKFMETIFLAKSKHNEIKLGFYVSIKDKTKYIQNTTQAQTHTSVINVSRTWLSSVIPKTSDIRAYTWK